MLPGIFYLEIYILKQRNPNRQMIDQPLRVIYGSLFSWAVLV